MACSPPPYAPADPVPAYYSLRQQCPVVERGLTGDKLNASSCSGTWNGTNRQGRPCESGGPFFFGLQQKIGIATNHSHNSEPRIGSTVATAVSAPHGHNRVSTKATQLQRASVATTALLIICGIQNGTFGIRQTDGQTRNNGLRACPC